MTDFSLVAWIDRLLLPHTLLAEQRGRRLSWRLGDWSRTVTSTGHELALRFAASLPLGRLGSHAVDIARKTSPHAAPPYPSFFEPRPRRRFGTDGLLRGERALSTGKVVRLDSLSWLSDPFGPVSSLERLLFHSLDWVEELIDAWRLEENPRLLQTAFSLTDRWIQECLYAERNPEIWSDHATAIRAVVLCRLWCLGRDHKTAHSRPSDADLLRAILRHGRRLAHRAFYRSDHNHGVTQAYALLAVGLSVPSASESPTWVRLAGVRLAAQLREAFSPEGLHLEHSPYYQFYVYRQLADAYEWGSVRGVSFPDSYAQDLIRCYLAGLHLIKPGGHLTALGDTAATSPILADLTGASQALKEPCFESGLAAEFAAGPQVPMKTALVAPHGGIAVFRSEIAPEETPTDQRYVSIRLGTHPTSHVHRDVFSLELYAYGADLLVDTGGPYAYVDPMRTFIVSTRAHNTVVVDDQDQEIGVSRILQSASRPGREVLVAEHSNYRGVTHRRSLAFCQGRYLVLVDALHSEQAHSYQQLFHLSPMLKPALHRLDVTTTHRSGGPTLRLFALSDATARIHRGETEPFQGWVVTGERSKRPNPVIEYERAGRDAVFVAVLLPEPASRSVIAQAALEGDPSCGAFRVCVTLDGFVDWLEFFDDGLLR